MYIWYIIINIPITPYISLSVNLFMEIWDALAMRQLWKNYM